ncbi:quinon protein alcohol dehydrogenase-like superfamily [Hygrophoropsis aurantiaca]|uniref:Quinon protein alcohol dehydrogenase-like superfamily n=1 Tax=Hygrophoropsis aurantiaca TaxID=72124 RepID=A0ACB7ZXN6_9AGAM|nr:quinon protein alcohol dehydrogenase-like superfamily [Hygrophoropsis aurantiaca]
MSTPASVPPELETAPAYRLPTKIFKGHTEPVSSLAYFEDGKRIVSGSWDNTVRIWTTESGEQEGESLVPAMTTVKSIAISPDQKTLVIGGRNGVALWRLENRAVVWEAGKGEAAGFFVANLVISSDGQLIGATADDEGIAVLDVETGERFRKPFKSDEYIWCLAFSADGTRLAAGSGIGQMRVFDVATGETVVGPTNAHTKPVSSVVFTLDGRQIITASHDKSIRVWDSTTGQEVGEPMLGHKLIIEQIALCPDGRRLASASDDGTVRIWDLITKRQVDNSLQVRAQDALHPFFPVAWSPDGRSVIAGESGYDNANILLWDIPPLGNSDAVTPPVLTAGNPTLPSTSRSRTSLSPSILDLPARSPIQSNSNHSSPHDDFWDISDIDLSAGVHTQIPSFPRDEPPATDPSIPATETSSTSPNTVPSTSPAKPPVNLFARTLTRFRHEIHGAEKAEMRPQAPRLPKYSPVVKVPLAEADAYQFCCLAQRLYVPKPKKKKPKRNDLADDPDTDSDDGEQT